jgi:nucleotide-binding universal stress UspA family protein
VRTASRYTTAFSSRPTAPRSERATREGDPSAGIVAYADERGCDLIVVGTHGRGGVDRLLFGSVAERVVRTATGPVLTVRVESATGERADVAARGRNRPPNTVGGDGQA